MDLQQSFEAFHPRRWRVGAPLLASLAALLALVLVPAAWATTTWSAQTSGTTNNLRAVAFTSATTGWAVGDTGTGAGDTSTILKTSDGGATWTPQASGTTNNLRAVAFTSATTGWAVGDTGTGAGDTGTILKTTNGGANWAAQTSGVPVTADLYGVTFVSDTTGWAVGASGTILTTTNGGDTWTSQTSPTTNNLRAVTFTDADTGWAVGASGTILTTTDGGDSWQSRTSGTTNNLRAVTFTSATTGWAVGDSGTILATTNGGDPWAAQISTTNADLYGVTSISATTAWAVGDSGKIVATTDGADWTAQTSVVPVTADLYGVTFVSDTTGWAVGASGTILTTTNGGDTWTPQTSGTTKNLRAVTFTSDTTGWAVGASGTILATANGGATWTPRTSGTTNNLRAVAFTDADTGWAVGASGTIVATTNGGATWAAQDSSTTSNLLGVAFTSPTTGWAVGYDGRILGYSGLDSLALDVGGADTSWHRAPVDLTVTTVLDDRLSLASLAYSTDAGATWAAVPGGGASRTLTIASEGTTTVVVRAVDSAGQLASDSATVSIDTQPSVSVSGGGAAWRNKPVTLTIRATVFARYTLAALQYSRNGGTTWSEVPGDGTDRTLTITRQGTSKLLVRVTDSAGQAWSAFETVKIDSVKPTSKAKAKTLKRSQARKGKRVSIKVTLKDPTPSCGSARLVTTISTKSGHRLGRTTLAAATVNRARTVSVKLTKTLKKGTYYIFTRATDKAGNLQAKAGKVKLRVK